MCSGAIRLKTSLMARDVQTVCRTCMLRDGLEPLFDTCKAEENVNITGKCGAKTPKAPFCLTHLSVVMATASATG